MIYLLCLAPICLLLYKEIVFLSIRWALKAQSFSSEKNAFLSQKIKRAPRILFCKELGVEFLGLKAFGKTYVFVHESFWQNLSDSSKTCILLWVSASNLKYSVMRRSLGYIEPKAVDRDCLLMGSQALDLIELLEKSTDFRRSQEMGTTEFVFSGLSLLGPGFSRKWTDPAERISRLNLESARQLDNY